MSSQNKLKRDIRKLLKERNAVLLAHNYQRDEVQEIADFSGDSFGLSKIAAETECRVIVFCGVHFMAESAAILSPEKTVILPRLEAGCPMADMITADALKKKRRDLKAAVVCYVNSPADVKAESDICCTSSNAVDVVNSLDSGTVLMVPDKNLSLYVAARTDKRVIPWQGFCPTHHLLKREDVLRAKKAHPSAPFIAHPECTPEILELADHICSTSGMYVYAKKNPASKFIIGTETGILYRLKKENPEKRFIPASKDLICPNMKITTIEDVLESLESLRNIVTVPEKIRIPARRALDRMLAVPPAH